MTRGLLTLLGISTGFVLLALYWRVLRSKKTARNNVTDSGCGSDKLSSESSVTASYPDNRGDHPVKMKLKVDIASKLRTQYVTQSDTHADLSCVDAEKLAVLLMSVDGENLEKVLVTITNAAAFTENQNTLREAGCLDKLQKLLSAHLSQLRGTQAITQPTVVTALMNALNNLTVNEQNQVKVQDSIPELIELGCHESCPEGVQLATLQTLTNLSYSPTCHAPYTQLIQQLFEMLDLSASMQLRRQALVLLCNLSSNPTMVPHLLAAKAPRCLLDLLDGDSDERHVTSWLTMLANILATAVKRSITYSRLPPEHKAASPETLYSAIHGLEKADRLKSKVFVLSSHNNDTIRQQAARLYNLLV